MSSIAINAPHMKQTRSVRFIMGMVLLALLPAALLHIAFFGYGVLWQFLLAATSGLLCEAVAVQLRGKSLSMFLTDGSTLVTAALLALSMPPLAPWWLIVSAMAFAILLGKHVYGGLGANPFNPAMLGYAVLLVSFPRPMTSWLPAVGIEPPGFTQAARAIFNEELPAALNVDVLSAASPLAALKSGLSLRHTMDEILARPIFTDFLGDMAGRGWVWISLALLLGGVFMLALRIIRWQIPVSMLMGLGVCALLMNLLDPGRHAGMMFHLFSGATMLGAFFIATDPVTAATSAQGRLVYGAGIGVLTYVIRDFGNYHDGLAFAVLLMNLAVPLIDKFTVPRIYGESR
ncbi:MAG: electron transport complex subunit RsxD [Steroidobacteraceae bacterium]